MKKLIPFLVLPILFLIQSCSTNNSEIETDFLKRTLKGDVVLVYNKSDSGYSYVEVYNDNGMLTKKFAGKTGMYYDYEEITYDNDKKLSMKRDFDLSLLGGDFSTTNEKYSYDQNGRLESMNSEAEVNTYEYDEEGRLSIETNKTKYKEYGRDGKMEYFYSGNKLDSIINYVKYDDGDKCYITRINGNNYIYEKYNVSSGEKKILSIYNEKKNETGDIFESVTNEYDIEGNLTNTKTTKQVYDYDEKKNWIQLRRIENGELKDTESRTIVYKGGETSIYINEMEKIISSFNGSGQNSNNSTQNVKKTQSSGQSSSSNSQSVKVQCSSCDGSGKCKKCGKTFRKNYYKGNGSYDDRNETKPGFVKCSDCFGRGHKQVRRSAGGWEPGGDCSVSGCEDGWRFCSNCNNSGNGRNIGQCQKCKGTGFRN